MLKQNSELKIFAKLRTLFQQGQAQHQKKPSLLPGGKHHSMKELSGGQNKLCASTHKSTNHPKMFARQISTADGFCLINNSS
jgi:hypothetical protein